MKLYDEVTSKLAKMIEAYSRKGFYLNSINRVMMDTPMISLFFTTHGVAYERILVLVSEDFESYQEYEATPFGGSVSEAFD